jgi:hypothetical protein
MMNLKRLAGGKSMVERRESKADQIESIVRGMHEFGKFLWLRQLRGGTGWGPDGDRTMDLWGIHDGKPWERVCIEIKVIRSDFRRDVADPIKQRRGRLVTNQFYYAAPPGTIPKNELPIWAGLIEIDETRRKIEVPAPWFDSSAPTWRFLAQIARTVARRGPAGAD